MKNADGDIGGHVRVLVGARHLVQTGRDQLDTAGVRSQSQIGIGKGPGRLESPLQFVNREINQQILNLAIQLADYENAIAAINVLARTGDEALRARLQMGEALIAAERKFLAAQSDSLYQSRPITICPHPVQ